MVSGDGADVRIKSVVDISDILGRLTLDLIGDVALGYSIGAMDKQDHELFQAFSNMLRPIKMTPLSFLALRLGVRFPALTGLPLPYAKLAQRSMAVMAVMKETSEKIIAKRLEELEVDQLEERKDLLSCLVQAKQGDVKDQISNEEVNVTIHFSESFTNSQKVLVFITTARQCIYLHASGFGNLGLVGKKRLEVHSIR